MVEMEASVESVDVELFGDGKRLEQRGINDIFILNSESLSVYAYQAHVSLAVMNSFFSCSSSKQHGSYAIVPEPGH